MLRVLFKIGAGRKRSKTVGFETLNESSESSFLVGAVEKNKKITISGPSASLHNFYLIFVRKVGVILVVVS